jgi:hypothetical protein
MARRDDPYACAQFAMPFLGAIVGASLEAQVAAMRTRIDGLTTNQLRQLSQEARRDGVYYHVAQVIDDELTLAIRETADPDEEDVPNDHGVYEDAESFLRLCRPAVEIEIWTARTRWGWVASWQFRWKSGEGGSSLPNVRSKGFQRASLAAADQLDGLGRYLSRNEPGMRAVDRTVEIACAAGLCAEHAVLLRSGLLEDGKQEKKKAPARRARKAA